MYIPPAATSQVMCDRKNVFCGPGAKTHFRQISTTGRLPLLASGLWIGACCRWSVGAQLFTTRSSAPSFAAAMNLDSSPVHLCGAADKQVL
jgi:hypothetical protein